MANPKKLKIKKRVIPTWIIAVVVILLWTSGLYLGTNITEWARNFVIEHGGQADESTFIFIFITLAIIIAFPIAILISKVAEKFVSKASDSLEKIAHGDYNSKIEYKTNNEYLKILINNFNKMVDQLNSVTIMRQDFISSYSHEFKTPMVSIKGYAELLRDEGNLTEEQMGYVKIIISECNRMLSLAEKSMLLSKIDNEAILTDRKVFSVSGQIEECILIFDSQLADKDIDLKFEIDKVKIKSDRNLIKQIWINIIGNAIKYTPEHGKIFVKCADDNNGNCVVTIQDNGIGMDEESVSKVFDKYFQADSKHSKGGMGLGLALCKRIVELANGKIECQSEKGKGTTFTVTIPKDLE